MSLSSEHPVSRRGFLQQTANWSGAAGLGLAAGPLLTGDCSAAKPSRRPKVAAIFTEFRFRSHAYNILENFFKPYLFNGKLVDPGVDVVSFFADQFPDHDMAREVSKRLNVPLYPTIEKALCLGGKELAVDGVLSIGEHGEYPLNKRGQVMYPRKRFFDQAFAVMQRSQRFVPLFNDKPLSYRWDWAKEMYDTSREHGMPFMAGSSVPLAQRRPTLELPVGAEIEEAVSIHGGGMESYDFHAWEVLQSFVESRKGGECGISNIELVTGDKLKQAIKQQRWSAELVEAAMNAEQTAGGTDRQQRPDSEQRKTERKEKKPAGPHAVIATYKDGFRATILKVGNTANRWNFACKIKGESKPRATTLFNGPWGNRCLFKALCHSIQYLFINQKQPYPIERTLLVTGALDAAMRSHDKGGRPIETPHLELAYQPIDFRKQRESGASWKIITKDTAQPSSFDPGDAKTIGQ